MKRFLQFTLAITMSISIYTFLVISTINVTSILCSLIAMVVALILLRKY
ncbi:hypothetical protein HSE3_gp014 [Bacillus phage vB_BceM-HSE3]|nr:hypothetical protein HSE3_gp014 [Bacillus phage vB_BceM-HSE3]